MNDIAYFLKKNSVQADRLMLGVLWGLFLMSLALSGMHDTLTWALVIGLPTVLASVTASKDKGGPINVINLDLTTGIEFHVLLTARNKARHPNAARLFANYVIHPKATRSLTPIRGE